MWSEYYFWGIWLSMAIFMEFWAMFLHGVLWHGPWWITHKSHHRPRQGYLEFNDIFSVFHALLAMFLIIYGFEARASTFSYSCAAAGFGMTSFGIAYFVVHDGFIHERLPVRFLSKFAYMRRLKNAHKVHHFRDHEHPFGLFLGEYELRWYRSRSKLKKLAAKSEL